MHHTALPQHPHFYRTLALLGAQPDRLGTDDGQVIVTRRRFGPLRLAAVLRAPPLGQGSLRRLRHRGVRLCEPDHDAHHDAELGAAGFHQVMSAASVADLPLDGTRSDRRARMHGKWRNRLTQAEQAGLTLRDMPFAGAAADWLIAQEMAQRRARGYRALHPDFARAWASVDARAARLFVAEDGGAPIAAMLILIHGAGATYHLGWSGPRGRATSAHHLILSHAGDWLAERGVVQVDLGTVDTDGNPGLARFKIGCGAAVRRLGGSWIALPGR